MLVRYIRSIGEAELRGGDREDKVALKLASELDGPIVSAARETDKEAVSVVDDDANKEDQVKSEIAEDNIRVYGGGFGASLFSN